MVVAKVGGRHAERFEDVFIRVLAQRIGAPSSHDSGEQRVAGVTVGKVLARRKVQALLAPDQIQDILLRFFVHVPPPRETQERPLVAQSARMVEEVPQGDLPRAVGQSVHVTRDEVVEGKLAGLLEHEHGRGRELLGERGDVEHRVRRDRRTVLEVGHSVFIGVDDLAVLHDPHRVTGQFLPRRDIEELVDLDRKSTRLNSSHVKISYAVFCLKKKKKKKKYLCINKKKNSKQQK